MSFIKKLWQSGEKVTAAEMNRIETGIENLYKSKLSYLGTYTYITDLYQGIGGFSLPSSIRGKKLLVQLSAEKYTASNDNININSTCVVTIPYTLGDVLTFLHNPSALAQAHFNGILIEPGEESRPFSSTIKKTLSFVPNVATYNENTGEIESVHGFYCLDFAQIIDIVGAGNTPGSSDEEWLDSFTTVSLNIYIIG